MRLLEQSDSRPSAYPRPAIVPLTAERDMVVPLPVRWHYMDALRGVLMSLGVLLHAAKVYETGQSWRVSDPETSPVFDWIVDLIHVFRMPAFFIIAGFFTLFTLKKYGPIRFLGHRAQRIFVPMACTAILLNGLQAYLCTVIDGSQARSIPGFLRTGLLDVWAHGEWQSHLWFLNYLLAYALLVTIIASLVRPWDIQCRFISKVARFLRGRTRVIAILALSSLFLSALGTRLPGLALTPILGIMTLSGLLKQLPFFLFGLWLFQDGELRREFTTVRLWHVAGFATTLAIFALVPEDTDVVWMKIVRVYGSCLLSWICALFCFALFSRFCNAPSRFLAYLSDASYSVYLFHHILVIAFGYLLLPYALPVAIKYLVLVASVAAATLAIHHFLILRFDTLRLMFNGKRNPRVRHADLSAVTDVADTQVRWVRRPPGGSERNVGRQPRTSS